MLLGFLENGVGSAVSIWHRKSDKDLLFPPTALPRALEIARGLFMSLDLAAGIEKVRTRDVLEEHLCW